MPDLVSLGIVTVGLELTTIGFFLLAGGWAQSRTHRLAIKYKSFLNWISNLWGRAFLPAMAVFVVVLAPLAAESIRNGGNYVYVIFEYPSNIDFGQGEISLMELITNDTDRPFIASDFRIIDFMTNTKIYATLDAFDLCADPAIINMRDLNDNAGPIGVGPITIQADRFVVKVIPSGQSDSGRKSGHVCHH